MHLLACSAHSLVLCVSGLLEAVHACCACSHVASASGAKWREGNVDFTGALAARRLDCLLCGEQRVFAEGIMGVRGLTVHGLQGR